MLVVYEITCKYLAPAAFDELLQLKTIVDVARGAKVVCRYELRRDHTLLATGRSVLACIDREGRVCRLPNELLLNPADAVN